MVHLSTKLHKEGKIYIKDNPFIDNKIELIAETEKAETRNDCTCSLMNKNFHIIATSYLNQINLNFTVITKESFMSIVMKVNEIAHFVSLQDILYKRALKI